MLKLLPDKEKTFLVQIRERQEFRKTTWIFHLILGFTTFRCKLVLLKDVFQISLSTIGSTFQSAFYSHLWKRGKIPNILVSFEKVDL